MVKRILLFAVFLISILTCYSQVVTECPKNIGFERGDLSNWECQIGDISGTGALFPEGLRPAEISLRPPGPASFVNHRLFKSGQGSKDPYGGFSLDSPNGSDYVVRLGNSDNGRGAERISYSLKVPANVENYSIVFNYAVVFENPPHDEDAQPRFKVRILDDKDTETSCGSFTFTAPGFGRILPGFERSRVTSNGDPVFYKPWAPVMINLSNYRGKTVKLEFTTNDCSEGEHFGYAYIDFNENCSIPVTGNITCNEASSLTLKTLPGFKEYRWFNAENPAVTLGTEQTLVLNQVPKIGAAYGVDVIPYTDLGCPQHLTTVIDGMSFKIHQPPARCVSVDITAIPLVVGNSSDLTYTYWKDPDATIPLSDPRNVTISGTYFIKATSSSGCPLIEAVNVTILSGLDIKLRQPRAVIFPGVLDITNTFTHEPDVTYSYWADSDASVPIASDPRRIDKDGIYYVKADNNDGCTSVTPVTVEVIVPDMTIPNAFTPNGDGINDVFTIRIDRRIHINYFRIYDRWGRLVFETPDINRSWTGFKGNSMASVGTYYWILEFGDDLKKYTRSGYVSVIR